MKKLVLCFVFSVLMAGASHGYVQVGHLAQPKAEEHSQNSSIDVPSLDVVEGDAGTPTAPVPEPGTIALASMGLAALGAAHRRRIKK